MTSIPLPKISKEILANHHPYPLQISYLSQRFIQGTFFNLILLDEGAGQYFNQPNSSEKLKTVFLGYGWREAIWETSWDCFQEYLTLFPNQIQRFGLFSMNSIWDWYIRKLGDFIIFAKENNQSEIFEKKDRDDLNNVSVQLGKGSF